ncbi:response regulator [Paenibacillus psychroresistens]|uniref:Response regulator n=1 Tax=Paenibacillus psychroresistens TaxID=1778678 RepID=A0A6B8RED3_9BACL|nr:response regulator [Paenibacillus psychroresistens]QGQ93905.1 response regulator [Paenibacillus psychroresistens]
MLRVFLVDDEEPVLALMERLLATNVNIEIVGKFTRPEEAISRIQTEKVDVVFLDIQMPGMNGIEAAEFLMEVAPAIEIVFVTAYNQYAINAFELNAVDYLLKPPTAGRLKKTVDRLIRNWEGRNQGEQKMEAELAEADVLESNKKNSILGQGFYCFGHFEWIVDAQTGETVNWRRLKDRELMAYLVHRRNRFVSKATILEDLWPGANPEQATAFLHTCVYNIRKKMNSLGCKEKLAYKDNGYRLELLELWCDAEEFERVAGGMEVDAGSIGACETAASLYKDNYLEKEGYIWAYETEKALKDTYITLLTRMADYYSSIPNYDSAMNCLLNAHKRHPFHDQINDSILLGYARMGDRQSMILHYERFTRLMKEELGIEPMETTIHLYDRLYSSNAKDIS